MAQFLDKNSAGPIKKADPAMNVFFLTQGASVAGEQLLCAAASLLTEGSLEVFDRVEAFEERARRLKDPVSVAVVINPSYDVLHALAGMRHFISGTRILFILPDQRKETVALAHRVLPTYIAYSDRDVPSLIAILRQLTRDQGANAPLERQDMG